MKKYNYNIGTICDNSIQNLKNSIINDDFYSLSTKEKYEKTNEYLKQFLLIKIYTCTSKYNEYKNMDIKDLLEIIETTGKDSLDTWSVVLFLLQMVSIIKEEMIYYINDKEKEYKDMIILDYNTKNIKTYEGINPLKMYDFIKENLYNLEYLDKNTKTLKK